MQSEHQNDEGAARTGRVALRDMLATAAATLLVLGSVAPLGPVLPTDVAYAQPSTTETVPAEILVILASRDPGAIAPELSAIPGLRRAPFSDYPSMSLLASHPISLILGTPVDVPLPNGRVLRVVAEERSADGRFRTRVSINRPGEADYLPLLTLAASPCDPFFVAGQSFGGGTLVIGVRLGSGCVPASAPAIAPRAGS